MADKSDDADERQRLTIQLVHAGVGSRLLEAAFGDDGPIYVRKSAVGADHFDVAVFLLARVADGRRRAQVARQIDYLVDDARRLAAGDIGAGHVIFGVVMGDDVSHVIDHENRPATHAVFLQHAQDRFEGNDCREHARKVIAQIFQRHGDDECGPVVGRQRQRITPKGKRLHRRRERPLQCLGYEWILVGAKIALRGHGAFAGFANGGQIEKRFAIAVGEIFEEAGDFGLGDGIFDVVAQPHERHDLPFADQLLVEVGLKQFDFARERARQVGLLN